MEGLGFIVCAKQSNGVKRSEKKTMVLNIGERVYITDLRNCITRFGLMTTIGALESKISFRFNTFHDVK